MNTTILALWVFALMLTLALFASMEGATLSIHEERDSRKKGNNKMSLEEAVEKN